VKKYIGLKTIKKTWNG